MKIIKKTLLYIFTLAAAFSLPSLRYIPGIAAEDASGLSTKAFSAAQDAVSAFSEDVSALFVSSKKSALPDGTNNAWCNAAYTVTDANGQVMGCFRVGAGQPVGAGRWDAPLPQICPQSDTQYTVTLTLTAVQDAAGSGPSGTAQAACSSTAQVFVQP